MLPHVIKSIADRETPVVTPVHGPRSMKLGSGKVVGKVLIVDRVCSSAKLLFYNGSSADQGFRKASNYPLPAPISHVPGSFGQDTSD